MSSVGLIIQIAAIIIGLLAIGLFVKANTGIMRFRKLTQWGLLQLWTGSITTQKLIIVESADHKVVEKELIKAIVMHKWAKIIFYAAIVLNVVAFLLGAYSNW